MLGCACCPDLPTSGVQIHIPAAVCGWQISWLFLGRLTLNNLSILGFLFQGFVADKPLFSWVCRELRERVIENWSFLRRSNLGSRDTTSSRNLVGMGLLEHLKGHGPPNFSPSVELLLGLPIGRIQTAGRRMECVGVLKGK